MAHACHPSPQEKDLEFKASMPLILALCRIWDLGRQVDLCEFNANLI